MSWFSDVTDSIGLTGGSNSSTVSQTTNKWTDDQEEVSKKLGSYLGDQIGQSSEAYTGQMTAGLSDQESSGLDWLDNYMNQDSPEQWGWANDAVQKAITGSYDDDIVDSSAAQGVYDWSTNKALTDLESVQSSDIIDEAATDALYESIKRQVLEDELPELQNTLAGNANLSGMYFSGQHEVLQNDLLSDVQGQLLDTLAELKYEDETQRRELEAAREERSYSTLADLLGSSTDQQYTDINTGYDIAQDREARELEAADLASELGQLEDESALNKAQAGIELGGVSREVEQAELDADYQEYLRTLAENNPALAQALAYLAGSGLETTEGTTTSTGSGILSNLGLNISI